MDINVDKYIVTVDCDDNSCSLRYKLSGGTIGVMRYAYVLGMGKRIKQDVVLLKEMDLDAMIASIMFEGEYSPELGESVVQRLKEHSYEIVNKYIKETLTPKLGQAASD